MRPYSRKPWLLVALAIMGGGAVAVLAAGCASIIHGTTQNVGISSTPGSAKVLVDGRAAGQTPLVTKLSRKEGHAVRVDLEGYLPFETTLQRKVDGWVWGNIVFGGLVGLAVDAISGGMYKLTPEQIRAELKKEGAAVRLEQDQLLIAVVLRPDPGWQRIGDLEPTDRP